jgi:hypothetical protein
MIGIVRGDISHGRLSPWGNDVDPKHRGTDQEQEIDTEEPAGIDIFVQIGQPKDCQEWRYENCRDDDAGYDAGKDRERAQPEDIAELHSIITAAAMIAAGSERVEMRNG